MRSWLVSFIAALPIATAAGAPARADYPWMFAQVTCTPVLGYFSIRRITIMNLSDKGPYLTDGLGPGAGVDEALRRDHGIVGSKGLEQRPFSCSIVGFNPPPGWGTGRPSFEVKVVGHLGGDVERASYCDMENDAEVILNGKSIGKVHLYPCDRDETIDSIEVAHDGVELMVKKCVEPSIYDNPDGRKIVCSEAPFRDVR